MATVKGVVEKVWLNEVPSKFSKSGTSTSVTYVIDGNRYSGGFLKAGASPAATEGDTVEIMYDDGTRFNNVKALTVVSRGSGISVSPASGGGASSGGSKYRQNGTEGGFPIHPLAYERALDRRNALNAAILYAINTEESKDIDTEMIIDIAKRFEAYTTGDLDREEAMAMMAETASD